jgi:ketosteroid isomerase-like protein
MPTSSIGSDSRRILGLLSLVLLAAASLACKCRDLSVEESLAGSDFVFSATVIGSEQPAPLHYTMGDKQNFSVKTGMVGWRMATSQTWKGAVPDTVAVYSDKERAACGYTFEAGRRYLVFAKASGPEAWHNPMGVGTDGVRRAAEGWPAGIIFFPVPVTDACTKTTPLERAKGTLEELGDPRTPGSPAQDLGGGPSQVRTELLQWNVANTRALRAKDLPAIMALRTEDFHAVTPDSARHERAEMEGSTHALLDGIDRWISMDFELDSLELDGDLAHAVVRQHIDRMARRQDGKVHHVETWVRQRETWRRTSEGWKMYRVDSLHDQRRLIDGQPG